MKPEAAFVFTPKPHEMPLGKAVVHIFLATVTEMLQIGTRGDQIRRCNGYAPQASTYKINDELVMPSDGVTHDRLCTDMTLLIFDCDGVLVDSERLACARLAELMTKLGRPMTTEEAVLVFTGYGVKDVLARAEEILCRPIPEQLGYQAARQLLGDFRRELTAVAGVREAIAALPYRRCVASSSPPDRLMLSLELTGLSPLFGNDVFSAVQVASGKPAPDLFLFAARSLGEDPSGCVVIEDSTRGVEAARAAGMAAIGFAGASHASDDLARRLAAAGADTVIRSMADLPSAVERLVGRNRSKR